MISRNFLDKISIPSTMLKSFKFPNLIFFLLLLSFTISDREFIDFKKLGFIFSISGIILFLILFLEYLFFLFEESILYFKLFSSHKFLIVFLVNSIRGLIKNKVCSFIMIFL